MSVFGANMRSWMRQPKSGRLRRSPGAVPRMTKMDWRTFSSRAELLTPPLRLIDTGKRRPLPRKSRSFAISLVSPTLPGPPRRLLETALDELSAFAAGDPGGVLDL